MLDVSRQKGIADALQAYGCVKSAGVMDYIRAVPRIAFGNPGRYFQELRHGKFLAPGGLLRESLNPRVTAFGPTANKVLTGLNAASLYGLPLYQAYQAYQMPESERGTAVGSSIGATLGSTLAAPLGVVGGLAGSVLGSTLGGNVGHAFDARNTEVPLGYR